MENHWNSVGSVGCRLQQLLGGFRAREAPQSRLIFNWRRFQRGCVASLLSCLVNFSLPLRPFPVFRSFPGAARGRGRAWDGRNPRGIPGAQGVLWEWLIQRLDSQWEVGMAGAAQDAAEAPGALGILGIGIQNLGFLWILLGSSSARTPSRSSLPAFPAPGRREGGIMDFSLYSQSGGGAASTRIR